VLFFSLAECQVTNVCLKTSLVEGGILSFIVPAAWLGGPQYINMRLHLLSNRIEKLVLLPFDVFANAYVDTLIVAVKRSDPEEGHWLRPTYFQSGKGS